MKRNRIVVTGVGIVSPIGIGKSEFWSNLLAGKSGVDRISRFDASSFPTQLAAEVKHFHPERYLSERTIKYTSRSTQYALAATKMALEDAGMPEYDPSRTDVIMGSGVSSMEIIETQVFNSPTSGREFQKGAADPMGMLKSFINAPACAISLETGARGYITTASSACASGINAVGLAYQRLADGRADMAVTGGVDTPITRFILGAYCSANFLTTENEKGANALCPFDAEHTKAVLGEGSAVFILEKLELARLRGAPIYAEITDFIHHNENINELYFLDTTGLSWSETLKKLKRKKIPDHINAHGPSDKSIDRTEALALSEAYGRRIRNISSIKGAVGSGMASAGVFQIAACLLTMKNGIIPPTFNFKRRDEKIEFDPVRKAKKKKINFGLVSGHAVGGVNTAMSFRRAV